MLPQPGSFPLALELSPVVLRWIPPLSWSELLSRRQGWTVVVSCAAVLSLAAFVSAAVLSAAAVVSVALVATVAELLRLICAAFPR